MRTQGRVIDARHLFPRPLTAQDMSEMLSEYERAARWRRRAVEGSVVLIVIALLASVLWLAGGL